MARVLVTGAAGYIGSHTVRELMAHGHEPCLLDDLSRGHIQALPTHTLHRGSVHDRACLARLLSGGRIDSVIHFAAFIEAGQSVRDPLSYFWNNVTGTLSLLQAMIEHGVQRLVFSSTAAVYGDSAANPIPEDTATAPASPYGLSKWQSEQIIREVARAYPLEATVLRYFNAAGAHPEGGIGEDHSPETHLIPLACLAALQGGAMSVFGQDYPTEDGTCVRDYVHVCDLAAAHVLALEAMLAGEPGGTYNVGTGQGYSVRRVIERVQAVSGRPFEVRDEPRRPGDPARLVADSSLIRERLGWSPRHSNLDTIVRTAWEWHRTHPKGYASTVPSSRTTPA